MFAASTDSVKVYDSASTHILDIVMKPHSQVLDMKVKQGQASQLLVAEYCKVNKSVILSHVPLSILNMKQSHLDDAAIE